MKSQAPKRRVLGEEDQTKMLDRLYTLSLKSSSKRRTEYNEYVEAQVKKQHPKPCTSFMIFSIPTAK